MKQSITRQDVIEAEAFAKRQREALAHLLKPKQEKPNGPK